MENFFGLLKSELLYLQQFDSLEHFKQVLVDYLDYYNNRRIKIKLKGLPPALHRQQALSVLDLFLQKYCLTFWGHFNYSDAAVKLLQMCDFGGILPTSTRIGIRLAHVGIQPSFSVS